MEKLQISLSWQAAQDSGAGISSGARLPGLKNHHHLLKEGHLNLPEPHLFHLVNVLLLL